MPEAVVVSALRTPIGTAFKGTLRDTNAFDLAHLAAPLPCRSRVLAVTAGSG